jgi:hypothetical protein
LCIMVYGHSWMLNDENESHGQRVLAGCFWHWLKHIFEKKNCRKAGFVVLLDMYIKSIENMEMLGKNQRRRLSTAADLLPLVASSIRIDKWREAREGSEERKRGMNGEERTLGLGSWLLVSSGCQQLLLTAIDNWSLLIGDLDYWSIDCWSAGGDHLLLIDGWRSLL